jgi:phage repressor protein C with HTH and peptisase S24 domain
MYHIRSRHNAPKAWVQFQRMDNNIAERLAWARRNADFRSPRAAAKAHRWNENTYKSRESGERGVTNQDEVKRYADAFGVDFIWLLTGVGTPERRNIAPIMGRIGAGAVIESWIEQMPPEGFGEVDVRFSIPSDAIAFEVVGESMAPRYDEGDLIICSAIGEPVDGLLDDEAAVRTANGDRYLKRIEPTNTAGLYDLISYNAKTIRNVEIQWASPVLSIVRARYWKRLDKMKRPIASPKTPRL